MALTKIGRKAVNRFFINGIDLMGQHHTPDDLAFSMLHELDLFAEGEPNELNTPAKVAKAKKYVADFSGNKEELECRS